MMGGTEHLTELFLFDFSLKFDIECAQVKLQKPAQTPYTENTNLSRLRAQSFYTKREVLLSLLLPSF